MSHLEELTLYLDILDEPIFIDGNHLDNVILIHMPQLHTFTFYVTTENVIADPFKFNRLEDITNNFPNIVFNTVTRLMVCDKVEFKHEFFIRLVQSFPFVKHLSVSNMRPPFLKRHELHLYHKD
jgi:hypothetical protein